MRHICEQVFCVIGFFQNWAFTFPVSLIAASMGVAGCQESGCYIFLAFWTALALAGIGTQMYLSSHDIKLQARKEGTITYW